MSQFENIALPHHKPKGEIKMIYSYGLKLNGNLVENFSTPVEAHQAALFAYQETGVFHEVVLVYGI